MLYHFTPGRDSNQGLRSVLFKIADVGWSGVDLFFTLSGFLVTCLFIEGKISGDRLGRFLLRRGLRIVPVYFVALAGVFVLVPAFTNYFSIPSMSAQLPFWLFVSNYLSQDTDLFNGMFIVGHFWSLAVEVQFYLLWPIVILALNRRQAVRVIFALMVFAILGRAILSAQQVHWTTTFLWLPFRIDCLLAGALVALVGFERKVASKSVGYVYGIVAALAGAILAAIAWYDLAGSVFKNDAGSLTLAIRVLLPVVLFAFYGSILALALGQNWLSRVLSWKIFAPIARYSYSMYVIHYLIMPILFAFVVKILPSGMDGDARIYARFIVAAIIVYVLSMLSYYCIEKPFISYGAKLTKRPQFRGFPAAPGSSPSELGYAGVSDLHRVEGHALRSDRA